jgi:hypothetical protein
MVGVCACKMAHDRLCAESAAEFKEYTRLKKEYSLNSQTVYLEFKEDTV